MSVPIGILFDETDPTFDGHADAWVIERALQAAHIETVRLPAATNQAAQHLPHLGLLLGRYLEPRQQSIPGLSPRNYVLAQVSLAQSSEQMYALISWLKKRFSGSVVWLPLTNSPEEQTLLQELLNPLPGSQVVYPSDVVDLWQLAKDAQLVIAAGPAAALAAYAQQVRFTAWGTAHLGALLPFANLFDYELHSAGQIERRLSLANEMSFAHQAQLAKDLQTCEAALERILQAARNGLHNPAAPLNFMIGQLPQANTISMAQHLLLARLEGLESLSERDRLQARNEEQALTIADYREQLSGFSGRVVRLIRGLRQQVIPTGSERYRHYLNLRTAVDLITKRQVMSVYRELRRRSHAQRLPSASIDLETSEFIFHPALERDYAEFISRFEPGLDALRKQRQIGTQVAQDGPLFSIVTPIYNPPLDMFRETMHAVLTQTYPKWEWIAVDGSPDGEIWEFLQEQAARDDRIKPIRLELNLGISENTNHGLRTAQGDFIVMLDHDDTIASRALFVFAQHLQANPDTDLIYSDMDKLSPKGYRILPLFKPDWSPEMMFSANYITHLCAYRRSLHNQIGYLNPAMDGAQDWDFYLRLSEVSKRIGHVPEMLYHWRQAPTSTAIDSDKKEGIRQVQAQAIDAHLKRTGINNGVIFFDPSVPVTRVHPLVSWQPQKPYQVSIIIPSKDKASVLEGCLASIVKQSSYTNFEILIVDTGSLEPATFDLYNKYKALTKLNIVPYEGAFNFSKACNVGAASAQGDLLLFLNNDTEVLTPNWLELMIQWFDRPGVGIVGAKLLYPNGRIQHGGVTLGMGGLASHLFILQNEYIDSIFGSDHWYRNLLAVTGACLMINREAFDAIGGWDEDYKLNYSDVELCIQAHLKGYRVVYTPHARLKHYESVTHGRKVPRADFERASAQWAPILETGDPFFNPNLSVYSAFPRFRADATDNAADANRRLMQRLPQKSIIDLSKDI